jgi:3-isopropylmalate/(R)-2-methylmalate dehydratase small subunit
MKTFGGEVLFLDRTDINTDDILPARYLSEISKEALRERLFEDLQINGFSPWKNISNKKVIISRQNFGCGSSREQAVYALEVNGIGAVIAPSFARIFRQNMFNCGMLAIELSESAIKGLFEKYQDKGAHLTVDLQNKKLILKARENKDIIPFSLSSFDEKLVKCGGWLEYAQERY